MIIVQIILIVAAILYFVSLGVDKKTWLGKHWRYFTIPAWLVMVGVVFFGTEEILSFLDSGCYVNDMGDEVCFFERIRIIIGIVGATYVIYSLEKNIRKSI